jgi:hypothetical protein
MLRHEVLSNCNTFFKNGRIKGIIKIKSGKYQSENKKVAGNNSEREREK